MNAEGLRHLVFSFSHPKVHSVRELATYCNPSVRRWEAGTFSEKVSA
jgi:hypothetical protein